MKKLIKSFLVSCMVVVFTFCVDGSASLESTLDENIELTTQLATAAKSFQVIQESFNKTKQAGVENLARIRALEAQLAARAVHPAGAANDLPSKEERVKLGPQ